MSRALLAAAQAGDVARVQALVSAGAPVDWVSKSGPGRTSLSEAALHGHLSCVHVLLAAGATVDWADQAMGFTPLAWAASEGHLACVQALLSAGASVEHSSKSGLRPLMVAAGNGHLEVVRVLLEAGAPVSAQSHAARNALTFARDAHREDVVQVLLTHGATPPIAPEEPSIPWPASETLDRNQPEQVVRAFMLAMHRWEIWAQQTQGGASTDWALIRTEASKAAEPFVVAEQLTQVGGSFGAPPRYGPDDALVSSTQGRAQAVVLVRQSKAQPVRAELRFTLKSAADGWRIAKISRRFLGEAKWAAFSLMLQCRNTSRAACTA